jgi:hypothetical protein
LAVISGSKAIILTVLKFPVMKMDITSKRAIYVAYRIPYDHCLSSH